MPSVTEIAENVPSTQMALQRWMAMEMRWNRNDVSLLSPEVADKRLPSLDRKWTPFTQIGPKVSKARGQKLYLWVKSMYFDSFFEAASSAAPPTVEEVDRIYEAANVSDTVNYIPNDWFSLTPWYKSHYVRSFSIRPCQTWWLFANRNLCWIHCAADNIIQLLMTWHSSGTETTGKTTWTLRGHHCATVAFVRLANVDSQSDYDFNFIVLMVRKFEKYKLMTSRYINRIMIWILK